MGNKAHTLLAKMLREDTAQRAPYSLCNEKGTATYDTGGVAKIFYDFFLDYTLSLFTAHKYLGTTKMIT